MPYKVTKTVLTKTDLISECTPCHGIGKCIGSACKLYQVSKFLNMSCAYLFYDQTDKVIEFFKGDIDIEKVEDSEESDKININILPNSINKNSSIVNLNGKTLVHNNGEYKKLNYNMNFNYEEE